MDPAGNPEKALMLLFHDPPWKPWIIIKPVRAGSAPSIDKILEKLDFKNDYKNKIGKEKGHVAHARLIPLAISLRLREKANGKGSERECLEGLIKIFEKAASMKYEENIDRIASAIDRLAFKNALDAEGVKQTYKDDISLVNPFVPTKRLSPPPSISSDKIINFIKGYSELVAEVLAHLCEANGFEAESLTDLSVIALNVSYLLLEPSWYWFTGSREGHLFVPVADTRIPTHTIFDHLNSVLVSKILVDGALAVVDLAGVQDWIRESRRLRDLWASSWIASYLAWKGVEWLVRKYGPGVLISPPGRLNPFFASAVLGPWLESILDKDEYKWIWTGLGFDPDVKWPINPVIPSRLLIAVPSEELDNFEEKVKENIKFAWKQLWESVFDEVKSLCAKVDEECCYIKTFGVAPELEPPLAVRITVGEAGVFRDVERSTRDALIAYDKSLRDLWMKENKRKIKAPGRRAGSNYMNLVEKIYNKLNGEVTHCNVCGKGIAVVRLSNYRPTGNSHYSKAMGAIGAEDLCPYCLTKRLLTRIIKNSGKELINLELSKAHFWKSVWEHTSRLRLIWDLIEKKDAQEIQNQLGNLKSKLTERESFEKLIELWQYAEFPPYRDHAFPKPFGEVLDEERASMLWSVIVEAIDDPRIKENILKATDNPYSSFIEYLLIEYKKILDKVPRRYAILVADGDFMGKGLLSGRLPSIWLGKKDLLEPMSPKEYLERVAGDLRHVLPQFREPVEKAIERLSKEIESALRDLPKMPDEQPSTIVVTPSYHMTVSRSLAVVSYLDGEAARSSQAEIIYLGGDDALLIAPPAGLGDKDELDFPALKMADSLRSHWYTENGFIFIRSNGRILHVAPAPAAYGRSIGMYLADVKYPMWFTISAAFELEELKDDIKEIYEGGRSWQKDIIAIGSDVRGAVIHTWLFDFENAATDVKIRLLQLSELTKKFDSLLKGNVSCLSKRVLHDLPVQMGEIGKRLINDNKTDVLSKLFLYALNRYSNSNVCKDEFGGEWRPPEEQSGAQITLKEILKTFMPISIGISDRDLTNMIEKFLGRRILVERERVIITGLDHSKNPYYSVFRDGDLFLDFLTGLFALAYLYGSAAPLGGV